MSRSKSPGLPKLGELRDRYRAVVEGKSPELVASAQYLLSSKQRLSLSYFIDGGASFGGIAEVRGVSSTSVKRNIIDAIGNLACIIAALENPLSVSIGTLPLSRRAKACLRACGVKNLGELNMEMLESHRRHLLEASSEVCAFLVTRAGMEEFEDFVLK